ncbi:Internalin-J precursor [Eubacteriaceae bacterium CHKCI004]|nr:Internalin-J precursor [Eubacteriaceae bacterium CHKCI004]
MRKYLKPFIFTALACTFLLSAEISIDAASKVAINDTNFARAVKEYAEEADTNKDGYLSKKEASKITKVRFFSQYNVDSFKGIEYFTDIKEFYYRADYATDDYDDVNIYETSTAPEIDLSGFQKLSQVTIDSRNPYLKTVSLQDCNNLKNVVIEGRREGCVENLSLKGCTNLRTLTLDCINVKKLNLSGLKKLTDISASGDYLETLNLKKCSSLKTVFAGGNCLTKLKLKGAKNLENLTVTGSALSSLDLSTNTKLKKIYLGQETKLTSLDFSHNTNLTTMECYRTELTALDFSHNKNLVKVDCHNNKNITSINVKGCKKLKNFRFDNTKVSRINVKTNSNLQRLRCENTALEKLNLKNNVNLKKLRCDNTELTTLDLSNTKIRKSSALQCDPDVTVTYAK